MGCQSSKEEPSGRRKKAGKYTDDKPVSEGRSIGRQGGKVSMQENGMPQDGDSASRGRKSSHASNTGHRLTLTKGNLGKNSREEEEWRKERSTTGSHHSASILGGASPTGSFRSSRQGRTPGRYQAGGSERGVFEFDETKSVASLSDKESVMTSETFVELAGKKVNRPRSAKGHVANEPSAAEMKDRITRHAMKGLLSDIDDTVEPATMIRTSNWKRLLTEKRRKAARDSSHRRASAAMPGIVDIVDVNNHSGDKSLDDVLSLMSYFPCSEQQQQAGAETGNNNKPPLPTEAPPKKLVEIAGERIQVVEEDGSDDEEEELEGDDTLRRTSLLIQPGQRDPLGQREEVAVGRFHFSEQKKLHRYYERHVKPWVLDYLFDREQIDPALLPCGGGLVGLSVVTNTTLGDTSTSPSRSPGAGLGFSSTDFGDSSLQPSNKDPMASRTTVDSGPSLEEPGLSNATSANHTSRDGASASPQTKISGQMGEDEVMAMYHI